MTSPTVSVVVPSYNHAAYLPRRLNSILEQTFRDYELILLDDASSDGSEEILQSYRDEALARGIPTRLVCNAGNGGSAFAQWNRGVEIARGRWIWIAESDDDAQPTLLERLLAPLARDDGVVLAYCESESIDDADRTLEAFLPHLRGIDAERWCSDFLLPGDSFFERYGTRKNPIPNASAVVFERAGYRAVGGADPGLRFIGDWDLWRRLARRGSVSFCSAPLNRFRGHAHSVRSERHASVASFGEFCTFVRRWTQNGMSSALREELVHGVQERLRKQILAPKFHEHALSQKLRAVRYAAPLLGAPGTCRVLTSLARGTLSPSSA